MSMCLLRVNGLVVTRLDLRPGADAPWEILVLDPQFGEFALSPGCLIEYLDIHPALLTQVWVRLTYEELMDVLHPFLEGSRAGR